MANSSVSIETQHSSVEQVRYCRYSPSDLTISDRTATSPSPSGFFSYLLANFHELIALCCSVSVTGVLVGYQLTQAFLATNIARAKAEQAQAIAKARELEVET